MESFVDFIGELEFGKLIQGHSKQVGYAFRNTANESVKKIQEKARAEYPKNFTVRNTFSVRGIVYDRSKSHEIDKIEAIVGGAKNRPYLRHQEQGFESSHPQGAESARQSKSYKKPVSAKNYMKKIRTTNQNLVPNKAKTRSGKAKAMLAIMYRKKYGLPGSGEFFLFQAAEMYQNMDEGIYQFSSKQKIQGLDYPKITLAYRLGNKRKIKAKKWLTEAIEKAAPPKKIVETFEKELREQIKKFK